MREEAAKALAELRAKGMAIYELPPAEAARMRAKLTRINASVGAGVGMYLWNETQAALATRSTRLTKRSAGRMLGKLSSPGTAYAWPGAR